MEFTTIHLTSGRTQTTFALSLCVCVGGDVMWLWGMSCDCGGMSCDCGWGHVTVGGGHVIVGGGHVIVGGCHVTVGGVM